MEWGIVSSFQKCAVCIKWSVKGGSAGGGVELSIHWHCNQRPAPGSGRQARTRCNLPGVGADNNSGCGVHRELLANILTPGTVQGWSLLWAAHSAAKTSSGHLNCTWMGCRSYCLLSVGTAVPRMTVPCLMKLSSCIARCLRWQGLPLSRVMGPSHNLLG